MEPEKDDGPLLEAVAQPLSREASVVLEQPPADGVAASTTEIPDPTQTPPPAVMLDGTMLETIGKNLSASLKRV